MSTHTCQECCTSLSYLTSGLAYEADWLARVAEAGLPWWWRLRHPLQMRDARIRAAYAQHLLEEAGK